MWISEYLDTSLPGYKDTWIQGYIETKIPELKTLEWDILNPDL